MISKSIKSVETAIITVMGLDKPPHQKSLETNLQSITGDIFQNNTNQLMTPMPSPKLSNCKFISVDKMDQLSAARLFLGLFDGNAS